MSAYAELAVTTNFSFLARRFKSRRAGFARQGSWVSSVSASPTATPSRASCGRTRWPRSSVQDRGRARLVFSDGSPDILAYPEDRAAWGRLTRLLTVGKDRAEKGDCILGLPDLLDELEGLNLIVMPPSRINSDALVRVLRRMKEASRRSVWLAASLLYRGDDRRRLAKLQDVAAGALRSADRRQRRALSCARTPGAAGCRHLHSGASNAGGGRHVFWKPMPSGI